MDAESFKANLIELQRELARALGENATLRKKNAARQTELIKVTEKLRSRLEMTAALKNQMKVYMKEAEHTYKRDQKLWKHLSKILRKIRSNIVVGPAFAVWREAFVKYRRTCLVPEQPNRNEDSPKLDKQLLITAMNCGASHTRTMKLLAVAVDKLNDNSKSVLRSIASSHYANNHERLMTIMRQQMQECNKRFERSQQNMRKMLCLDEK